MCLFPILEAAEGEEEIPYASYPLHTSLYFVLITITTVGYGDISPVSIAARFATMAMICVTFVLLPMQATNLADLLATRDRFTTPFVNKRARARRRDGVPGVTSNDGHVLIIGTPRPALLSHLADVLVEDKLACRPLLVLSPSAPDASMTMFLARQMGKRFQWCAAPSFCRSLHGIAPPSEGPCRVAMSAQLWPWPVAGGGR